MEQYNYNNKKCEYNLQMNLNELNQQIVGVESIIETTNCIVFKQPKNNYVVKFAPTINLHNFCQI